tara:strand:- start:404 stop:1042 length:639 start_codon:yes stop_codon:yes gene_type:complete
MEIDNKTAKKVLIRAIQRQGVDADNLMNKRSPTQWQDFPKKADKLLKSSTARVRLEANIKKRGLTTPNQKNVGKVLNRLNRMSIPYDSYSMETYNKKTGTKLDSVIGNKKLNVNKSQKLYESSNKGNQNLRSTRLSKYNAERTIGTNQGYKGYSGKLDTKKSDLVKDIKKFRTMGNIKKLTPVGLIGAIMQPKKVGDATLKKTINRNPNFPR